MVSSLGLLNYFRQNINIGASFCHQCVLSSWGTNKQCSLSVSLGKCPTVHVVLDLTSTGRRVKTCLWCWLCSATSIILAIVRGCHLTQVFQCTNFLCTWETITLVSFQQYMYILGITLNECPLTVMLFVPFRVKLDCAFWGGGPFVSMGFSHLRILSATI